MFNSGKFPVLCPEGGLSCLAAALAVTAIAAALFGALVAALVLA